ncbi:reverse transcriptase domain-containing protein [Tanacetum coccineum]
MFRYGETHSEAVNLLIFRFSLSDEAKTWFNELNKESITSWEQMRRAFINRFFPPSLFNRLLLKNRNFSQNVCESLTDAWLRLKNMLQKCHGHSLTKGAIIQIFYHCLDEPTQAILDGTARGIFLYKSPNQAFQFLEDKVLLEHEWPIKSKTEHHQKSVSFADGSDSNTDNSRLIEKLEALTLKIRLKIDEWSKSQNISSEQTDRTEPQPPPQAHTEQVNVVFTGSGKSDDSPKTQKDPPPPIIVDNKTKKDKPIKTTKKAIMW